MYCPTRLDLRDTAFSHRGSRSGRVSRASSRGSVRDAIPWSPAHRRAGHGRGRSAPTRPGTRPGGDEDHRGPIVWGRGGRRVRRIVAAFRTDRCPTIGPTENDVHLAGQVARTATEFFQQYVDSSPLVSTTATKSPTRLRAHDVHSGEAPARPSPPPVDEVRRHRTRH